VSERNKDLVRRAVEEIWNQGDLALADVLFTPTYVNHGDLIPDLIHGPEASKSGVALYRAAFPDFYLTVERSRHPSSRCAAHQIAESWTTWDRAGVLRALGLGAVEEGQTHDIVRPGPEG
jgi:hypothetical protein